MRALALLAAAAMAISLFLPWLNVGVAGARFVPWDLVSGLSPDLETARQFASGAPPELLALLATFPLAGLFVVLSVVGLPSRLLALITGGLAAGGLAFSLWRAREGAASAGIPLPPAGDLAQIAEQATSFFAFGAFAWAGGALVLLLSGLAGFSRR